MNNRLRHVDIAKGIAILLVVFGHNCIALQSADERGKLFEVIYSFHMPLFFFISGVFFKPKLGLKYFAVRKTHSLLKPYFIVLSFLAMARRQNLFVVNFPTSHNFLSIIGFFFQVINAIIGYFFQVIYGIGNLHTILLDSNLVSSTSMGAFFFFVSLCKGSQLR